MIPSQIAKSSYYTPSVHHFSGPHQNPPHPSLRKVTDSLGTSILSFLQRELECSAVPTENIWIFQKPKGGALQNMAFGAWQNKYFRINQFQAADACGSEFPTRETPRKQSPWLGEVDHQWVWSGSMFRTGLGTTKSLFGQMYRKPTEHCLTPYNWRVLRLTASVHVLAVVLVRHFGSWGFLKCLPRSHVGPPRPLAKVGICLKSNPWNSPEQEHTRTLGNSHYIFIWLEKVYLWMKLWWVEYSQTQNCANWWPQRQLHEILAEHLVWLVLQCSI